MQKTSFKVGPAVQQMIARADQLYPFSEARGVLDNGCGSGSIISYILDEHGSKIPDSAVLIAGDFSDSMLDAVRTRKQTAIESGRDVWKRLEVRKLDAHDLRGLDDESMSHITGGHLYFLLEDHQQALREAHRVLCPGGIIGMTSGKSSQHLDALCGAVEEVRPGTNLKLIKEPWSTQESVNGELEACGFKDVEIHLVPSSMSYTDVSEFSDGLLKMPVMKEATAGFSESELDRLRATLIDNLNTIDVDHRRTISGINIVAIGRKAP